MPAHRFDGSTQVQGVAFIDQGGTWTDDNDLLWAWDGSAWQLIQPVAGSGIYNLLPVENLAAAATDHEADLTWDLPVQPDVDPNEVWVRILELSEVWQIFTYPVTAYSHDSLLSDTAYQAQVKLVLRELGEVVAESPVRSVFFHTDPAVVGDPAPDPGGGPGGSVIPITPLPGGGPVGGDGCWWAWELFIWDDDGFGWETTGITGTHDGDDDSFEYDLATLDPGRLYRFEFCEICDGVATGDCHFGDPFHGVTDWEAECAGILESASASLAPYLDAVWQIPKVCTTTEPPIHQAMFDGVSGLELAEGQNFGFTSYDSDSEWKIVAGTMSGTPSVFVAGIPAVNTTVAPGEDWTWTIDIAFWPGFANHSAGFKPLLVGAHVHKLGLVFGVASWSARMIVQLEDGDELVLDSNQFAYDEADNFTISFRWDDDGNKELWVDGTVEDTDTESRQVMATASPSLIGLLPEGMSMRKVYAWDRALSDAEMLDLWGGVSPIEFVYAWSGNSKANTLYPAGLHWLPGDFLIVAWWDYSGPSLTAMPPWMARLDPNTGTTNPSIHGGFIPDFYAMDTFAGAGFHETAWSYIFTTSLASQTNCMLAFAVYRNVSRVQLAVEDFIRERLTATPDNDTVGPVDVPTDGAALLFGLTSIGTGAASSFLFQSPATERLSEEISAARATRVFDDLEEAGGIPYTFETVDQSNFPAPGNDNNFMWALAANAGEAGYQPPYPDIELVGASNGSLLTGSTITVDLPGGIGAGDVIVVGLHLDANQSAPYAALAGWRQITIVYGGESITVFLKRATSGEADPTFTAVVSGAQKQYACAVYRNVGAVNWIQGGGSLTLTPTPTTTVAGTRAVAIAVAEFYQPISMAVANGYTERAAVNNASDGGIILCDKTFSSENAAMNYPEFQAATNSGTIETFFMTMIPGEMIIPVPPEVEVIVAPVQDNPALEPPILFDIIFDQPVTGLVAGDLTLGGTSGGTKVCTELIGGPIVYRAKVKGMTTAGTVTCTVGAGVCAAVNFSATNNAAPAAASCDYAPVNVLATHEHWYDFSQADTLTLSGGDTQVAEIDDRVGSADLTAPNNDPVMTTINGHAAASSYANAGNSANTNAYMGTNFTDIPQPFSVAIVCARRNSGFPVGGGTFFDIVDDVEASSSMSMYYEAFSSQVLGMRQWTPATLTAAGFDNFDVHALVFIYDGASSEAYLDGVSLGTFSISGSQQLRKITLFNTVDTDDGHDIIICEFQCGAGAEPEPEALSAGLQDKWS